MSSMAFNSDSIMILERRKGDMEERKEKRKKEECFFFFSRFSICVSYVRNHVMVALPSCIVPLELCFSNVYSELSQDSYTSGSIPQGSEGIVQRCCICARHFKAFLHHKLMQNLYSL